MATVLRQLARLTGGTYRNDGVSRHVELPDGVSVSLQHGYYGLLWVRAPSSLYVSIGQRDHVATEFATTIRGRRLYLPPEDIAQAARLKADPVLADSVDALLGKGEMTLINHSDIIVGGSLRDAPAEVQRAAALARLAKHVTETWQPGPPREPDIPDAFRRFAHFAIGDDGDRSERLAATSDEELLDLVASVLADYDALDAQANDDSDVIWLLEALMDALYELGERGVSVPGRA
jgi:hypothetical protein